MGALKNLSMHAPPYIRRFWIFSHSTLRNEPKAQRPAAGQEHLAELQENPWVYYETNVAGTLNLLQRCPEYGIKKFTVVSTSSLSRNTGDEDLPPKAVCCYPKGEEGKACRP